jgi:hypothetical protein
MGKKRAGYVKIEVPLKVFEALEEVSEAKGESTEDVLMALVMEAHKEAGAGKPEKTRKGHTPNAKLAKRIRENRAEKDVVDFHNVEDAIRYLKS